MASRSAGRDSPPGSRFGRRLGRCRCLRSRCTRCRRRRAGFRSWSASPRSVALAAPVGHLARGLARARVVDGASATPGLAALGLAARIRRLVADAALEVARAARPLEL